jgi:hypothetical protein
MVTLLTFCMTGMVMGQQFNSPTSNDANDSVQRTNTAQSSYPNALITPLSDAHIETLKTKGLETAIVGADVVNEVILFAQGGSPGASLGIKEVRQGGDVLHLTLDDYDITKIKSSGLSYKYSRNEVGRFKTLLLHYKKDGSPNNSLANPANPFNNRPQPDEPANRYLPAPGPAASPGDFAYMGPAAPRGIVFDNSKATQDRSGLLSPSWNNRPNSGNQIASDFDPQRNTNLGGGFRGNQTTNNSASNQNTSQQNFDRNQSQFVQTNDFGSRRTDQNPIRNNQTPIRRQPQNQTPIQQSIYSNPNNQLTGGNNSGIGQFSATNPESFEERQLRELRESRLRQAAIIERKKIEIDAANADLEMQKLQNAKEEVYLANQEIIRRRNQLERRDLVGTNNAGFNRNLNDPSGLYQNQIPQNQTPQNPNLQNQNPQNQYAYNGTMPDQMIGTRFNTGAPPARNGQYPRTGNGVSPMSIPGPNDLAGRGNANNVGNPNGIFSDGRDASGKPTGLLGQTDPNRSQNSTEGIVYFMLLASLGLNLYLGLISRSFYVRYNELADELRETFTATM